MRSRSTRYRRRSSRIRWFRRHVRSGTVYLLVSRHNPALFKIGFTERLTKDTRRELERSSGEPQSIVFAISMPWACACEQRLHWYYSHRSGGRARSSDTKWYRLRVWESLPRVRQKMLRIAALTALEAWLKLSWPKGTQIRSFCNRRFFKGGARDTKTVSKF